MPLIQQVVNASAGFTDVEIDTSFSNMVAYAAHVLGLPEDTFYGPSADLVVSDRMHGRDMVFIITMDALPERIGADIPDIRAGRLAGFSASDMRAVGQDKKVGVLLVHAYCGWGES